jgi:hypothetical protein
MKTTIHTLAALALILAPATIGNNLAPLIETLISSLLN